MEEIKIIPWGIYAACLSRHEINMLNFSSRRWRPVEFGVELEGLIPFQNILVSGSTREGVSSFSNRPNLHIFVDDGHILPSQEDWNATSVEHNNYWGIPWGKYSQTKLRSPKFKLYNIDTAKWTSKNAGLPDQNTPQQLFSLYNTGKVQTMYPGAKFRKRHKVMNSQFKNHRKNNKPHIS